MLFFVLFALCFAQDKTYCYNPIKNTNEVVVAYEKKEKGDTDCGQEQTETQPELKGDVVCIDFGTFCKEGEGDDVVAEDPQVWKSTKCYVVNECFKDTDNTWKKCEVDSSKNPLEATVKGYDEENCGGASAGFPRQCNNNKCYNEGADNDEKCTYTKGSTDGGNGDNNGENDGDNDGENDGGNTDGDETKTEYCYLDAEDKDGKVVGYNKAKKEGKDCEDGFTAKDKDPKLDGDYVCKNSLSKCPAKGAELEAAICLQVDKCVVAGSGSMKYTVKDKKVTVYEYSSKNCAKDSTAQDSSKYDCDKCNEDLKVQYKCHVDGAFETAILLVIAFIFFLF